MLRHLLVGLLCWCSVQAAVDESFVREAARKSGYDEAEIRHWLSQARKQDSILKAISRPAEGKAWKDYRPIFLQRDRIEAGRAFLRQHAHALRRAENQYGVPPEIVTAIIGVETRYGRHAGRYRVLDALYTLGFHYPRRGAFFRKQLIALFELARKQQLDLASLKGSYAGAMGYGQFIPTSYLAYAVDFDHDGQADLLGSVEDAIGSVAHYLARHGWQRGQPIVRALQPPEPPPAVKARKMKPDTTLAAIVEQGFRIRGEPPPLSLPAVLLRMQGERGDLYWAAFDNFYAITRYNHSPLYAMAVTELAHAIAR